MTLGTSNDDYMHLVQFKFVSDRFQELRSFKKVGYAYYTDQEKLEEKQQREQMKQERQQRMQQRGQERAERKQKIQNELLQLQQDESADTMRKQQAEQELR